MITLQPNQELRDGLRSGIRIPAKADHHRQFLTVSRQLVYGHFVYDTSSTDISSTMTFLAEIEAGVMKRIL